MGSAEVLAAPKEQVRFMEDMKAEVWLHLATGSIVARVHETRALS